MIGFAQRIYRVLCRLFSGFESILLKMLTFAIKREDSFVAIGSWCGERYADNSRYLAEYIHANRKDLKVFWVGKKDIEAEVKFKLPEAVFLEINSFHSNLMLLKCKYMFFSQMHNADISELDVFRGAITCYLHHGMPIKKWGQDGLNQSVGTSGFFQKMKSKVFGADLQYTYFVTSSPLHDKTNCSSLAFRGCTASRNIPTGTPRNDMYFNSTEDELQGTKKRFAKELGFNPECRVVMYLPTYRRTNVDVFSFLNLSKNEEKSIAEICRKHNCVLIEKSHVAERESSDHKGISSIVKASSELNVQEMMLFADLLISDYSGAYLDYIILDKPVLHFAYDYDYYRKVDSGLYYDIDDFSAGPIAYDFASLVRDMDMALGGTDEYAGKRHYVRNKYMTYETGNASKTITETVIGGVL